MDLKRLRETGPHISVGVLTADLSRLGSEIDLLEEAGVGLIHVDVMDGRFCPTMTVGPPVVKAIHTPLLKDVHLMIEEPEQQIERYVVAGADIITVHVEAGRHPHRALQALGTATNANDPDRGIIRGLALNPGTPLGAIEPLLDEVEMIVLLAVNPGWSGQSFIESTQERLTRVRRMIADSGRDILLSVDGGVTRDNIGRIAAMRPDIIVTGSAVFDGKAPATNARYMMEQVGSGRP